MGLFFGTDGLRGRFGTELSTDIAKRCGSALSQIAKEIKRAVNLRSACQIANIGVSLILLGLIIPFWTRSKTRKKHAEALKQAETNSSIDKRDKNTEELQAVKVNI